MRKIVLYTLLVFFALPLFHLFASENNYKIFIDFFHRGLEYDLKQLDKDYFKQQMENFDEEFLKEDILMEDVHMEEIFKKYTLKKNILKKKWCAYWIIQQMECFLHLKSKFSPIGFNMHFVSVLDKYSVLKDAGGYHEDRCYIKMKDLISQNKNKSTMSCDIPYIPVGDETNLHTYIRTVNIEDDIKGEICKKCHFKEDPKEWISTYRFYVSRKEDFLSGK